jgi:mannose/cellobiose epimerase-like protein (N-acyl-D-glucosamine 2-epimerase family)
LTLEGKKIEGLPRRLMVQVRQLFVYTNAENFGWLAGKRNELVRVAENMVRDYFEADGAPGWVMAVDNKGAITDAKRDFYAHAFALLGMSCAYKLTNNKNYLDIADRTLAFLDGHMAHPSGGYVNCLPAKDNIRSQDPHMHLLEGLIALHDVAPDRGYLMRAGKLVQLFKERFFQQKTGTLPEDFAMDWSVLPGDQGRLFEPGHHCEWIWLLKNYNRRAGERDDQALMNSLAKAVTVYGRTPTGLLWSEVRDDGVVINNTSRAWPHTEAIRSALITDNIAEADMWMDVLYNRFLKLGGQKGCLGGWNEQWDAEGKPLVNYLPASSLYHIVGAMAEYEAKCGRP